jgi:hypothetical protein
VLTKTMSVGDDAVVGDDDHDDEYNEVTVRSRSAWCRDDLDV